MSAIEQPAAMFGRMTRDVLGRVRMSADSAMKWTPQKRTYSASLLGGGVLGELEAVAGEVGVLDDFVALVVVAEDDEALAELRAGGADATVELLGEHARGSRGGCPAAR